MERVNVRNEAIDTGGVLVCNCTSYCYFTLAIILFSVGTVITILALDDSENFFSSLGHMWVVGPIFISSGLMVAVKTIVYLRRETMVTFISRQRSLLRELHYPSLDLAFPRNPSSVTLPPSYDTVVGDCNVPQHARLLSVSEQRQESAESEIPPPSYEEAVLLNKQQQPQCSLIPVRRTSCQDSLISVGTSNQERMEFNKNV